MLRFALAILMLVTLLASCVSVEHSLPKRQVDSSVRASDSGGNQNKNHLHISKLRISEADLESAQDGPDAKSIAGMFKGRYENGWEISSFTPCQRFPGDMASVKDEPYISAWVEFDDDAFLEFNKLLTSNPGAPKKGEFLNDGVYVEWSGVLRGTGHYGQMAGYVYLFKVQHVAIVSMKTPPDCHPQKFIN